MDTRRLALVLWLGTTVAMVAMLVTSFVTGATQEVHEWYRRPDAYAQQLLAEGRGVRVLMGFDTAFIVLYTAFFALLARQLRALGRPLVHLAVGCIIATGILDFVEDHYILSSLAMVENGRALTDDRLATQQLISSVKFSISYLGLVCYGLAIPRTTRTGWAFSLFLSAGILVIAIADYALPIELRATVALGRWLGYLLGLGLAVVWLREQRASVAT